MSDLDNTRQATTRLVEVVNKARQRHCDEIVSLPQTADLHVFYCAAQHKVPTTSHTASTMFHQENIVFHKSSNNIPCYDTPAKTMQFAHVFIWLFVCEKSRIGKYKGRVVLVLGFLTFLSGDSCRFSVELDHSGTTEGMGRKVGIACEEFEDNEGGTLG